MGRQSPWHKTSDSRFTFDDDGFSLILYRRRDGNGEAGELPRFGFPENCVTFSVKNERWRKRESEREKEKTVVVHVCVGMSVMSRGEKGARNNKFLRGGRRGAPTIVTRLRLFNLFPAVFFAVATDAATAFLAVGEKLFGESDPLKGLICAEKSD